MKYILQVYNGSWYTPEADPEEIIRKIGWIASLIPVDKVMIGWNINASAYRKISAFLHRMQIQMVLWLPVFSEAMIHTEPDPALDLDGKPVPVPFQQPGEFVFCCPSSGRNIQAVKDIYKKHFSECGFDGVFLDRIRSQSFVSGVSGVLSCGCAECRKKFLNENVDPEEVGRQYHRKKDSFFDMDLFPMDGQFRLKDDLAQRFFEAKEKIIADAVTDICRHFKSQGLIVGLDLFAPVVSRFVGQNYSLITSYADFIKPMLYRKTEAPAGIGYEVALFEKYAPNALGKKKLTLDRTFLDTQLKAIGQAPCRKYPGIEINYHPDLVRTDAEYILESLDAVRSHGFEGAALCWNIMNAPETHFKVISEAEKTGAFF